MKTIDLRHIERLPSDNGTPGPRGVLLTNADGSPALGATGRQGEIQTKQFLLQQTGNAKFTERLEGIDAIELQLATRKEIEEQCAIDDGLIVLEDNRATRLAEAIMRPAGGYRAELSHNLAPFMVGAKNMVAGDLRKQLAAEAKTAEPSEAPAN